MKTVVFMLIDFPYFSFVPSLPKNYFYDPCVSDDVFYNSVLCNRGRGFLEFNLCSESKKMNSQLTSSQDDTTVSAYFPGALQKVILQH